MPTFGLRLHRCSHTYWHGVDETDFCPFRNGAGAACPWPRTLYKGVGQHWRGLQGWLPTFGLRSDRCSHTYWHGVDETDFCPFRNGAGAACPWPRTLGQGVGEHWRGLQGWLPTLGLRLHRCFHTYRHGVDETDFCPFRNGAGAACPWPRTLGQGVGYQWRGLTGWLRCRPWVSGFSDARTHLGLGVDATDFDHRDS